MIISASRRTDIPAFYAPWFMNRMRAGYCTVPNPFNRSQVSRISLRPEDVDVIVFWTRNPRPLLPALDELDDRGYRYYFQYTLLDNPRTLDPKSPPVDAAIATFQTLAERIGPARVIWRYDPSVLSSATGADFHLERYARIAAALRQGVKTWEQIPDAMLSEEACAEHVREAGWRLADVADPAPFDYLVGHLDRARGVPEEGRYR